MARVGSYFGRVSSLGGVDVKSLLGFIAAVVVVALLMIVAAVGCLVNGVLDAIP